MLKLWIFVLCLVVFRSCRYVTSCKMKHSVGNFALARGQAQTKARKSLESRGCCRYVDSASGLDGEKEDRETTNLKDIL